VRAGLHVVCRHHAALGVALAGVAPIECESPAAAASAIDALDGVVLVEEPLYAALPAATLRRIRKHGTPILIPFPGPTRAGGEPPEHELLEVLRRAVGYRMRLR
jgi:vacuolar-type H+-ATPase subunit F/Vma7